jgi:hypothetical protein
MTDAHAEQAILKHDRLLALRCLELAIGSLVRLLGIPESQRILAEYRRQLEEY